MGDRITNYPYPQYRKKCKALGADHFLDKSTEFDRVTEILNGWVRYMPVSPKRENRMEGDESLEDRILIVDDEMRG